MAGIQFANIATTLRTRMKLWQCWMQLFQLLPPVKGRVEEGERRMGSGVWGCGLCGVNSGLVEP